MKINPPFLVFLGDAQDYKQAKVAHGVVEWRSESCVGQMVLPGCGVDLGLPTISFDEAVAQGVATFLIGISPYTTGLPESYEDVVREAMDYGLDVASPLHEPLSAELESYAKERGVRIINFRHRTDVYPKGNGLKRTGKRLLTVGSDCACGKKYTALTISRAIAQPNTFRATGQTGYLISQSGINNDTIAADFLSGAAEWLTPENEPDHWDVVEGQGALSHPSFGAGALSLIYGTQPDVVVMCLEPGRTHQRGVTVAPMAIGQEVEQILLMGKRTNPNIQCPAYSLFTVNASEEAINAAVQDIRKYNPEALIFDPNVVMGKSEERTDMISSKKDFQKLLDLMVSL